MINAARQKAQFLLKNLTLAELAGMYKNGAIAAGISNGELIFLDGDSMMDDRWERIHIENAADAGTSYGNVVTNNKNIIARFSNGSKKGGEKNNGKWHQD